MGKIKTHCHFFWKHSLFTINTCGNKKQAGFQNKDTEVERKKHRSQGKHIGPWENTQVNRKTQYQKKKHKK